MTFETFFSYSDPEEAFLDQNLAKLGDCLVNLIYSLARSVARETPDGAKAPNRVLSESLNKAGLRDLAPSRSDRHDLGDVAEAIIAYAWLQGKIDIEEAAEILSESFHGVNFDNRKKIFNAAEKGFENLLKTIAERISFEKEKISRNKAGD
ncbi:hypothetical protein AKJ37_01250 [candidate division MSBL1 archaeon SCGC-AAA259I09]|uniref:Uncharacterized protein n=2 Tax=candidate division MSBL1 TaxID=215777 RepID=A0A133UV83_9EURY|nr:hypothetical protein AKJ37_01250 [candidate division MSBL1 archaeon SCGC-AAA259I09]KXB00803.1 hypothetical protein AKJ40_00500 [candidate division MSBL1 archaeon SCGC-AAA259M10]